jgi:hypothetical protein
MSPSVPGYQRINRSAPCRTSLPPRSLRRLLVENLAALLVTDERNVTYLTDFTGDSSYLLSCGARTAADRQRFAQQQGGMPARPGRPRSGFKITDFAAEVVVSRLPRSRSGRCRYRSVTKS